MSTFEIIIVIMFGIFIWNVKQGFIMITDQMKKRNEIMESSRKI